MSMVLCKAAELGIWRVEVVRIKGSLRSALLCGYHRVNLLIGATDANLMSRSFTPMSCVG